ncbi:hypothetical protein M404DRAFT_995742 [Pisolithus tinctorius Marx 270]|uniref:Uncharacterized protein n=1 Tax=Pisolithus tinctorius Marx 270 TaxID=870435 RepID=A0A0C3JMV3_PISTI|nr:hypothetical protein M404DRAFT_995742 [Pisolithus tinctorius Marx 270]
MIDNDNAHAIDISVYRRRRQLMHIRHSRTTRKDGIAKTALQTATQPTIKFAASTM